MLIVIRHGQTDANAKGLLLGRLDPELTPLGRRQAAALARGLPAPARVREACEELAALAVDRDVVVVTHVSPIKAAVAWALDVHDAIAWRMYVEDGAACRISVTPHGPLLRSFNEIYRP